MNINNPNVELTQISKECRDNFLKIGYTDLIKTSKSESPHYVYIVKNIKTGKMYVGRTINIYHRASDYTRIHRNRATYASKKLNLIYSAIFNDGIDDFIMYPIATCDNLYDAAITEVECMKLFNTIYPNGYNLKASYDFHDFQTRPGYKHSIEAKIKKAKLVMCINPVTHSAILSVGMKLFGDFTNSTKDLVKNCAKRPCMHRGYYVIYINDIDRKNIADIYYKRTLSNFKNLIPSATKYFEILKLVEDFINSDYSADALPDYNLKFLTYSEKDEYVLTEIDEFYKLIK